MSADVRHMDWMCETPYQNGMRTILAITRTSLLREDNQRQNSDRWRSLEVDLVQDREDPEVAPAVSESCDWLSPGNEGL